MFEPKRGPSGKPIVVKESFRLSEVKLTGFDENCKEIPWQDAMSHRIAVEAPGIDSKLIQSAVINVADYSEPSTMMIDIQYYVNADATDQ